MKIHAIAAAVAPLLVALLAGCAKEYAYIPPADPEGKACVAQCQTREAGCRREQDRRAAAIQAQCEEEAAYREDKCEIESNIEYLACLKFSRTDEDRKACARKDCKQPSCQQSGDYGLCGDDYRTCFQSCGGKIEVLD